MAPWRGLGLLLLIAAGAMAGTPDTAPPDALPSRMPLTVPNGLDSNRAVPPDNPLTQEKIQLGRRLFFDPLLSGDGKVACASCHQPEHGFSNSGRLPAGAHGKLGRRNAPSLLNRAYGTAFFWDGRAATLEAQALIPIESPLEMDSSVSEVLKRLRARPEYRNAFRKAFEEEVTAANLGKALASFERVLLHGDSRVDRFRAGDVAALNPAERHGLWLYESSGRCWRCHSGPNFTDERFHNTGVSWQRPPLDLGRFEVTRRDADRGCFKTPTLRAVALTAPYMHDGSFATLEDVVEFYNRGGGANSYRDPILAPLGLSKDDVSDLVAFLKALSDTAPTPPAKR